MILRHVRRLATAPQSQPQTDGQLLERFVQHGEDGAFEELLERHGPLVWRVCRHVLYGEHDAEDAFQATFLVLARRARSIRRAESLSSWLHGTALRVAMQAKRAAARRRKHEGRVRPAPAPGSEIAWRDLQAALDEEVQRLPRPQRDAFIQCVLEGKSLAGAAAALHWKKGTVSGTLARARQTLRVRLGRRGITLSAVLTGLAISASNGKAAPLAATLATVLGNPSEIPVSVANLSKGAISTMVSTRLGKMAVIVIAMVASAGLAAVVRYSLPAIPTPASQVQPVQVDAPQKPDERRVDAQGDPLPPGVLARMGTTRFRHGAQVQQLRYSQDGKLLASLGVDQTVRVWDAESGKELRAIPVGDVHVTPFALSPDGKYLATAGPTRVWIWDVATGKMLHCLEDPQGNCALMAFAPDSKTLAATSGADEIRLIDVAGGKETSRLNGPENIVNPGFCREQLAFSSDGKVLAVQGQRDNKSVVDFLSVAANKTLRTIKLDSLQDGLQVIAPDHKTMALYGHDEDLHIIDLDSGKERHKFAVPQRMAYLAYSSDSKRLAVATGANVLVMWDVASGKEINPEQEVKAPVGVMAFSPDGKYLAFSGHAGSIIHRLDVRKGTEIPPPEGHNGFINQVAVSPDGKMLATIAADHRVILWDVATGKVVRQLDDTDPSQPGVPFGGTIAFSTDGKSFAVSWVNQRLVLYETATGKELQTLGDKEVGVGTIIFSRDGRSVGGVCGDCVVRFWDIRSGKQERCFQGAGDEKSPGPAEESDGEGDISMAALSPNGKLFVTLGIDIVDRRYSLAHVWELATGKERRQIRLRRANDDEFAGVPGAASPEIAFGGFGAGLALSPDSRTAAITLGTAVRLIDLVEGKEIRQFGGHGATLCRAVFAPDGKTLVAGASDGTLRFWDTANGTELGEIHGHRGPVTALCFTPDGKHLVSGASDTSAMVWDVRYLADAVRDRPRPLTAAAARELLTDLVSDDAAKVGTAICDLVRSPDQALRAIKERARPVAEPNAEKIAQYIEDLASDDFATRKKATMELEILGDLAEPALQKRLDEKPDLEVYSRLEELLTKVRGPVQRDDILCRLRMIEVLEYIGNPESRKILEVLGQGAAGSRVTREAKAALARLQGRG